jgi:hypothetical protein
VRREFWAVIIYNLVQLVKKQWSEWGSSNCS